MGSYNYFLCSYQHAHECLIDVDYGFEEPFENLRSRFTIKWMRSRDASSLRAMWQNLSAPSSIEQTKLNGNDLHPSISFEPLIEDDEPNPTVTPNLAYKYTCSSMM